VKEVGDLLCWTLTEEELPYYEMDLEFMEKYTRQVMIKIKESIQKNTTEKIDKELINN
jgi:hypothetical protein